MILNLDTTRETPSRIEAKLLEVVDAGELFGHCIRCQAVDVHVASCHLYRLV